jgi:hypothetical protein
MSASDHTLKKYGLSAAEWDAMYQEQGGVCAICLKAPGTGRLCVDHCHVKGWKKMPPERRKLYVRQLLCWTCNLMLVGRGVTLAKLRAAVAYLERHGASV